MSCSSLLLIEANEKYFGQKKLVVLLLCGITYVVVYLGLIHISILIGAKFKEKLLRVPADTLSILSHGNETVVQYMNKHKFNIRKSVKDIDERDFEEDYSGRKVSYTDTERIFYNFYLYKQQEINKNNIKDTIVNNKELLRKLLENSSDIRKLTLQEIGTLDKRIIGNRKLLLLSLVAFAPLLLGGSRHLINFNLTVFMFILSIISIILMLTLTGARIFRIRNAVYYIMECNICDKKRVHSRRTTIYKIRCRDKRNYYLDDWFECEYDTYNKGKKANILVVVKRRKVYINSYDKMWRSIPKVIRI
jgi:hypothetical protein